MVHGNTDVRCFCKNKRNNRIMVAKILIPMMRFGTAGTLCGRLLDGVVRVGVLPFASAIMSLRPFRFDDVDLLVYNINAILRPHLKDIWHCCYVISKPRYVNTQAFNSPVCACRRCRRYYIYRWRHLPTRVNLAKDIVKQHQPLYRPNIFYM